MESDEVVVIIWLNNQSKQSDDETDINNYTNTMDGLWIYDLESSICLEEKGIKINPKFHPDFLSFNERFNFNVSAICTLGTSELVPRKSNRMIIIGGNRSFAFSTKSLTEISPDNSFENFDEDQGSSEVEMKQIKEGRSFKEDTMLAVVITLASV